MLAGIAYGKGKAPRVSVSVALAGAPRTPSQVGKMNLTGKATAVSSNSSLPAGRTPSGCPAARRQPSPHRNTIREREFDNMIRNSHLSDGLAPVVAWYFAPRSAGVRPQSVISYLFSRARVSRRAGLAGHHYALPTATRAVSPALRRQIRLLPACGRASGAQAAPTSLCSRPLRRPSRSGRGSPTTCRPSGGIRTACRR
jgi:hypothetical protein